MNTLTKVFVVLLLIFSITFTVMAIQFSLNVPDWKAQAEKWKITAQQVDTQNRHLFAAKAAQLAQAADDRRTWNQQRDQQSQELSRLVNELNGYKSRLAKSEADFSGQLATIKKLSAELGIAQTSAEKAREHRQTLEDRNIYLEQARLDLTQSLNEKFAMITVLDQQSRQQEQAVNLCMEQLDKVSSGSGRQLGSDLGQAMVLPPADKVRPQGSPRVAAIRGHIEEVSGELASISVGSNDGVRVGMTFIVLNDSGYLGDLIITDVEPDSSAGELKFVTSRISSGDRVVDEISSVRAD